MKHEPITAPAADQRVSGALPSRTLRRGVELCAHVLRGSGEIVDVALLDLSYEGCCIRTPECLWQGEGIKLSVPRRGVISASVRWCADGQAGLAFDSATKPPTKARVERASVRFPATSDVTLRRIGHLSFRVGVRDISLDGCRIDLVERPAIGETMHIKFEGLEVLECKVRWVDGYIGGLEFVRPIHPAVFDLLLMRLKAK